MRRGELPERVCTCRDQRLAGPHTVEAGVRGGGRKWTHGHWEPRWAEGLIEHGARDMSTGTSTSGLRKESLLLDLWRRRREWIALEERREGDDVGDRGMFGLGV
jgi:hypothetical protein